MNLSAIASVLGTCFRVGENVGLIGQPGVGKTEFIREFCKTLRASDILPELAEPGDDEKPVRFVSIATTTKEPVDFAGVPTVANGRTRWAAPEWIPTGNEAAVVFLDEFPQSELPTQLACQKMIDRDLDGVQVSPRAVFVIAGNRPEDNAGANEMPTHLRNRFAWFDVDCDSLQWCEWAEKQQLPTVVIDFIRFRPDMLNTFSADSAANAYATPRSVTKFAKLYSAAAPEAVRVLAAAKCGAAWAAEFVQFQDLHKSVPDIGDLLDNAATAIIPKAFGVRLSLTSAIVRHCKADKSRLAAVITVIERLQDDNSGELAAKCMRDLAGVAPEIFADPKASAIFAKLAPMLRA